MRRRNAWLAIILLLGLTFPARGEAGGLSNTETFGGFEFNFNNPGARALGMGGAFIGVADDATAAVTNPAGLVILQRPELSAEVKFTRFQNSIKAFSATVDEARTGTLHGRDFDDSVTTPSYFSLVFPTERLVAAVFVRELVNFESAFTTDGARFADPTGAVSRFFPVQSKIEVTALNVGAGVGVNLSKEHRLLPDIGASIEFSYGVVRSRLQRFAFTGSSTNDVRVTDLVDGSDIGVGFNVGALWRPLKELSLGVVYRRGPRYNMSETLSFGPAVNPTPARFFDFSLKVPDVYGLGVAIRPIDRLTISADVVRIRYSQMLNSFNLVFAVSPPRASDYKLEDATEFHVGAEYIMFFRTIPIGVRAGFYTNPDHRIRYTGPDIGERLLFPGGRDQYHGTAGVGIVPFPGVQFDAAVNVSREIREFSVSTVFRF